MWLGPGLEPPHLYKCGGSACAAVECVRWPLVEHESSRKPVSRDTKGGWMSCGGAEDGDMEGLRVFVSGYAGFGVFPC